MHTHDGGITDLAVKDPGKLVDAGRVPVSYRGRVDDLPLYQLDAVVLPEEPELSEAVPLTDIEERQARCRWPLRGNCDLTLFVVQI